MYLYNFVDISLCTKGVAFPLKQTQILFTPGCFLPSLVESGPVVLEKKMKMWKFTTTTTTTTTDNGQILIRKAHLRLRLRWAKKPVQVIIWWQKNNAQTKQAGEWIKRLNWKCPDTCHKTRYVVQITEKHRLISLQ